MNTQDIVAKLWSMCHVLRDDGITYQDYVTELTYLLFLKMMKETDEEKSLPKGFRWDDLTSCLLYTSPSPRDKRQSRMPSSA